MYNFSTKPTPKKLAPDSGAALSDLLNNKKRLENLRILAENHFGMHDAFRLVHLGSVRGKFQRNRCFLHMAELASEISPKTILF